MRDHARKDGITEREGIRRHLVAEHHWPEVWRYDASEADLRELHILYPPRCSAMR